MKRTAAPPKYLIALLQLCLIWFTISVSASENLKSWWEGRNATGDWLGIRDHLEDGGVVFSGYWKGTFYGLTNGGLTSPHGAFDEELRVSLLLDFGKIWGLEGLVAEGSVRYRDGRNPNNYVGASSTFNPSRYQSGQQWRLMPFYFTYTTPELLGVPHFLTISGGWQNAYDFFAVQPDSKLFSNNAIGTTKGLGGDNGFPWSSSYAAWGGFVKVQPDKWIYGMAGLYLAIPDATTRTNHGLDFAGYGPNPSENGLYFLTEIGITPKFGVSQLPGKYAFGSIYWGLENNSFSGGTYDQKFAFYWQADQMLFREETPLSTALGDRKSTFVAGHSNPQGLRAFTFLTYAPSYDNELPFYFHAGLVYQGLLPSRNDDQFGLAFGYGRYSRFKIMSEEANDLQVHQTYEAVIEANYRVQLAQFASVQPFWQYILRPDGNGSVPNANIFGIHFEVGF